MSKTNRPEMMAAALTWNKKPGRVAEMTRCGDMGLYAVSTCGRFRVYVYRRMVGDKGHRSYVYSFSAYDCATKADLLFVVGECQNERTMDVAKAFARCEQEVGAKAAA